MSNEESQGVIEGRIWALPEVNKHPTVFRAHIVLPAPGHQVVNLPLVDGGCVGNT